MKELQRALNFVEKSDSLVIRLAETAFPAELKEKVDELASKGASSTRHAAMARGEGAGWGWVVI